MGAFKAYDIRGIWDKDFNAGDVYRIGCYLPELMKTDRFLVGRDVRTSSPVIFEQLTRGLMHAGAGVYDLGLATTPYVYWATARYGFDASVQITASHNSKEYNGLKISGPGALPVGYNSGLNRLEQMIRKEPPATGGGGEIHAFDVKEEYMNFLKSYVPDISRMKVAIDCSNGMAALFIRKLLGDHPFYLFEDLDGTFPNHEANPLVPENVEALSQLVSERDFDLGVIFDGDADRVMFVDENGKFVSPDLIIALMAHYFAGSPSREVLQDIRSSKAVGEYIARLGFNIHTWKVGRAFASPRLREIDGVFGGEYAGHYYFRDFYYSDSGLLACLIVLKVASGFHQEGKRFSEVIAGISPYVSSGEINFRLSRKQEAMDAVLRHFNSKENPVSFFDFDGYRADYRHWWFNIRPSNTEPYLRFIAEADSAALLDTVRSEATSIIQSFAD